MFGGPEVSYHQIYSARDWLSILRTSYPTQNLQRKHRTDLHMTTKARKRTNEIVSLDKQQKKSHVFLSKTRPILSLFFCRKT